MWYLRRFAGLAIAWDLGARRAAGFSDWLPSGLRSDAKWLPVWFVAAPLVVYAASWSGWFATSNGYDRNWAAQHGNHTPIWSTIDSWYQYNHWMLQFGLGLTRAGLQVEPAGLAGAGPADLLLLVRRQHGPSAA